MHHFLIIGKDVEHSHALREAVREKHLQRLSELESEGRLLFAGPLKSDNPNDTTKAGSIILAKFENLAQAETWIHADPYNKSGVYQDITIYSVDKSLPK